MIRAVQVAKAVDAVKRIEQPQPTDVTYFSVYDVWLYQAVMDNRICLICSTAERIEEFNGNALRMNFPHLEIIDVNTIKANAHPNCRCYLVRQIGYEEPPELYPEIKPDKTLPSTVAKGRVKQYLDELPPEHLVKVKTIEVKDFLHVRGAPVAGAYYRYDDKLQFDYDCLGTTAGRNLVYHEVGHHVYDDIIPKTARNQWKTLWGIFKSDMPTTYAKTSHSEGFAESYMKYEAGESFDVEALNDFFRKYVGRSKKK